MNSDKMVRLLVDNKAIEVEEGTTLLQACLDNGIYIPNLCYVHGMEGRPASCRMCFVEIEGTDKPVPSCTIKVTDRMVVKTDTAPVRRLQRMALQLLLSVHHVACKECPANKRCELQRIAGFLKVGLKPKRLEQILKAPETDQVSPVLDFYPNRCVLCGRCIFVCGKTHKQPFLTFAGRGLDTVISFYGAKDLPSLPCEKCLDCVDVCPVGAIVPRQT
ncbi:MAG: 2Fe-2S iron-sulfur cluster-binding protein [Thermodesulfobacteriota bacterium]|nr:2Fe-2S iron-sulfur cluster-binding protein [Thermodesulfobacteriota bacterium]